MFNASVLLCFVLNMLPSQYDYKIVFSDRKGFNRSNLSSYVHEYTGSRWGVALVHKTENLKCSFEDRRVSNSEAHNGLLDTR